MEERRGDLEGLDSTSVSASKGSLSVAVRDEPIFDRREEKWDVGESVETPFDGSESKGLYKGSSHYSRR